jgi:FAD/FMN-containing dehydrogenase/Fe-S oxidoreductase
MHDFRELQRNELYRHLRRHIQGEVRFDQPSRHLYSTDASIYRIEPAGIVIPRTVDDLQTAVQFATETRIPITARGGGTSLSGQSIGPGLIIDCSKYLNQIVEIDPTARVARVQPGVVLDQFNRALAPHSLWFGPDVATASRANLGGMIGNNSAGARSIVYGKTVDHVKQLDVILADGSRTLWGAATDAEWERRAEQRTLEGAIHREVRRTVTGTAGEIRRRFPKILRRVSGYNLDLFANPSPATGLHQLIVGSEGTLAVIAEAHLNLMPKPKCRGLLVPQFDTLAAALDALALCLTMSPSAVELMDQMLIDLARTQLSLKEVMASIHGRPAALLMIEFSSDDPREVSAKVYDLQRKMRGIAGLTSIVPALDANLRDPLWDLRRAAMPLLYGMLGDRKPVTFVEDCAVDPSRLPEFAARFREILHRHGTDGAFYGHASVGCLHIRPLLNLHDIEDVVRMRQITAAVTDLVLEFEGSLSGEHGDGLARSEWNRKMFGPVVYEAFRQIKRAFDPLSLLNPGKIVDAPSMTENLRYSATANRIELPTVFDYSRQGGFFRSIELCNGAGVCRKTQGGAMCPSFRATHDEAETTRARANALRIALENGCDSAVAPLSERWVFDVMDHCLQCKACKAECPSNVDMAKLKAEFLQAYYQRYPRPMGDRGFAKLHRLLPWAAKFAPAANWLANGRISRRLMELTAGVDRRRSLPELHRSHLRRWFRRHQRESPVSGRRVILFDDCITTFTEPAIGQSAVHVLERAGYQVELAGGICCGRAMISKGYLTEARALARAWIPSLARRVADGTPILGLEPSCLLTLADEWPELVPGADARRVAEAAHLADAWLAKEVQLGATRLDLPRQPGKVVLHAHCHQKALRGSRGSADALRLLPGLEVVTLDAGCCGMAGSFGYDVRHYDLSVQIAGLELLPALQSEPLAIVAATGTSCRHQIRDLTPRRAFHPLEILAGVTTTGSTPNH